MTLKINWVNGNGDNADRTEMGYWESSEGRFSISPRYRHTIYPDSYELTDAMVPANRRCFDTVREAKAHALRLCSR